MLQPGTVCSRLTVTGITGRSASHAKEPSVLPARTPVQDVTPHTVRRPAPGSAFGQRGAGQMLARPVIGLQAKQPAGTGDVKRNFRVQGVPRREVGW